MHHKETEHYSEIKTAALEKSEVFEQQSKSDGNKNYTVFYRVNLNCFFFRIQTEFDSGLREWSSQRKYYGNVHYIRYEKIINYYQVVQRINNFLKQTKRS